MLNTLVHDLHVHKGSQWAVYVPTVMLVCEHKGVEETPSRIHGNQIIHFLLSHAYHEKRVYGLSNGLNSPKNGLI
jgi:hypothetical protein